MKTLVDGEKEFCSFCGSKLVEVFRAGNIRSTVLCPKWGKRPHQSFWQSLLSYTPLDFDHDLFLGVQQRSPNFDPITGERINV